MSGFVRSKECVFALLMASELYMVENLRYGCIEGQLGKIKRKIAHNVCHGCYRNWRKLVDNVEQRIAMVRNDREHGSRWLVHETISILYDLATQSTIPPGEVLQRDKDAGRELPKAGPAMQA